MCTHTNTHALAGSTKVGLWVRGQHRVYFSSGRLVLTVAVIVHCRRTDGLWEEVGGGRGGKASVGTEGGWGVTNWEDK